MEGEPADSADMGLTGGRDSEAEEESGSSNRKKVRLELGGGGVKTREAGEKVAEGGVDGDEAARVRGGRRSGGREGRRDDGSCRF